MGLTISPNTPLEAVVGQSTCFIGSAIFSLPEESARYIDLPASGTNWSYTISTGNWQRTGGTNGSADAATYGSTVYKSQPFYISAGNSIFSVPASPDRNHDTFVGVYDDTTHCAGSTPCPHGWWDAKFCTNTASPTCDGPNGGSPQYQRWQAHVISAAIDVGVYFHNFNEQVRLRSDGTTFYWEIYSSGAIGPYAATGYNRWIVLHTEAIDPSVNYFTFHLNSLYNSNQWSIVTTYKGSYQGSVPMTWSSSGGTLSVNTPTTACFSSDTPGTYQVCIDSEFDAPLCIDVTVDELYFRPTNMDCGECVFTNTTIKFESNGGLNGVLTATGGTVVDPLTWQSPGTPGSFTLTYTFGIYSISCIINVIETLEVINVSGGIIIGLIPGDNFQIKTNYYTEGWVEGDPINVKWENVDCPNVVTENGLVSIPKRLNDDCYGALDCSIRGTLVHIPNYTCDNLLEGGSTPVTIYLRIIVDPVFPTPDFGGPIPLKWKPETPDFRVIINEFEGGCDETYIRNRVPIYRWTVRYDGLPNAINNPCAPKPCCDEEQGFVDGFDTQYHVAQRLDDFWNLVAGTAGYFTLKDYRTGKIWRRVRFDSQMERDHINWRSTQSRNFALVWHPCCDTEPKGGVCRHLTTYDDNYAPTVPTNLAVTPISPYKLAVSWTRSIDGIGIKGYQLWIDGNIVDVDNVSLYYHIRLEPTSTHTYKVRAYDFSKNFSSWSLAVSGTTFDTETTPPTSPTNVIAEAVSTNSILVSWDASTDNVVVAGYQVMADGIVYDAGDVLSWLISGLGLCSFHSYFVRAYDSSGNYSGWSFEAAGHTACGTVMDGTEEVYEDSDPVTDE